MQCCVIPGESLFPMWMVTQLQDSWSERIDGGNIWGKSQQPLIFVQEGRILGRLWSFGGSPGGPDDKDSDWSAGAPSSIPGSGRSPGERSGNPLQDSCLENSIDRSLVGYSPRDQKSWTWLGEQHFHFHEVSDLVECKNLKIIFQKYSYGRKRQPLCLLLL